MHIDYSALAAWSAVVAAMTAVIALLQQSKRARFALGIDLLLKLNANWDSMRPARRAAAKALSEKPSSRIDEVLDFFEMIALLMHRGAIDETMVWHSFFYWVHRYCVLASDYIATVRRTDATIWEDLGRLHQRLIGVEKRRRRCSDSDMLLSPEDIREFLAYEVEG